MVCSYVCSIAAVSFYVYSVTAVYQDVYSIAGTILLLWTVCACAQLCTIALLCTLLQNCSCCCWYILSLLWTFIDSAVLYIIALWCNLHLNCCCLIQNGEIRWRRPETFFRRFYRRFLCCLNVLDIKELLCNTSYHVLPLELYRRVSFCTLHDSVLVSSSSRPASLLFCLVLWMSLYIKIVFNTDQCMKCTALVHYFCYL